MAEDTSLDEVKAAATEYKRRVAGRFMLVAAKDLKSRLAGSDFCVTRKIDGIMAYAVCRGGEATMIGSGGRDLSDLPVAKDLGAAVKAAGLTSATVAAELYAPAENGRPRVYDVLSALADPVLAKGLRLAPGGFRTAARREWPRYGLSSNV